MTDRSAGEPVLAETRRPRRWRWVALALTLVLVVAGYGAFRTLVDQTRPARCTAFVDGEWAELTPEQAGNAAIITAVALRRGLPERAATIAIATAMQESKLRNIPFGDRDSVGLFQQRPSQGWGTVTQILDPVYSAGAFYDRLVKVRDWAGRPLTEAAQAVQRSAYPDLYAAHETQARALAGALTGRAPASLTCTSTTKPERGGNSEAVQAALKAHHGLESSVSSRRVRADVTGKQAWVTASWAVAQAEQLGIDAVQVGSHAWNRKSGCWRSIQGGAGQAAPVGAQAGPVEMVLSTPAR